MTEVRDAGFSWKRSGVARSAPPLPGKEGEGAQQPKAQIKRRQLTPVSLTWKGREGMLVHRSVAPSSMSPVLIYTPGPSSSKAD